MDHPRDLNTAIAIDPKERDKIRDLFGPYMLDNGGGPLEFLGGLALSPEIQRREGPLNCAAWPLEEVSEDDTTRAAARLAKGNLSEWSYRQKSRFDRNGTACSTPMLFYYTPLY